jgi:hypothetical protein
MPMMAHQEKLHLVYPKLNYHFLTNDVVEFDGMVIFKGQDDGTGASNDPIVYTGVTLTFTGTLRAFFQRKYLSDFTITSVEGTFVSQSQQQVQLLKPTLLVLLIHP